MTLRSPVTSTKPNVNFYPLNANTNISYISFILYGTYYNVQTSKFICGNQSVVGFHELYV